MPTRVEKHEQRDNSKHSVKKIMTYGDSASTVPEIGQTFMPEIDRLFPSIWEEEDMGVLQDKTGKVFSNADGYKQIVREIYTSAAGAADWKRTFVPMERVPDSTPM